MGKPEKVRRPPVDYALRVREALARQLSQKLTARVNDDNYHKSQEYKNDLAALDRLNHALRKLYLKERK